MYSQEKPNNFDSFVAWQKKDSIALKAAKMPVTLFFTRTFFFDLNIRHHLNLIITR